MPKIGKDFIRYGEKSTEVDIFYDNKSEVFYVKLNGIDPGLEDYLSVYLLDRSNAPESFQSVSRFRIRGEVYSVISAGTKADCISDLKKFMNDFWKKQVHDEKIILYEFEYITETRGSDSGFRNQGGKDGVLSLTFKYKIVTKRSFGDEFVYIDPETPRMHGNRYFTRDHKGMKEIKWSYELEYHFRNFSKNFDKMIDQLLPIFTEKGRIIELFGSNILSNK